LARGEPFRSQRRRRRRPCQTSARGPAAARRLRALRHRRPAVTGRTAEHPSLTCMIAGARACLGKWVTATMSTYRLYRKVATVATRMRITPATLITAAYVIRVTTALHLCRAISVCTSSGASEPTFVTVARTGMPTVRRAVLLALLLASRSQVFGHLLKDSNVP